MAVEADRVSVDTSADKICEVVGGSGMSDAKTRSFILIPQVDTGVICLGPAGVTTGDGVRWDVSKGPFSIDLEPGESLYGITASGSIDLDVLSAGR